MENKIIMFPSIDIYNEVKEINLEDINFNFTINTYVPVEVKNDIIHLALQNAEENNIYNLVKLKKYFELYIVYTYANIVFSDELRADDTTLYNILKSNGIIDVVIAAIGNEYEYLTKTLAETLEMKLKYKNTIVSTLQTMIENLVPNAENAASILNNFNPDMFKQVIEFAQAANGGRPIE